MVRRRASAVSNHEGPAAVTRPSSFETRLPPLLRMRGEIFVICSTSGDIVLLDKLNQKRAVLVAQDQQLSASLNQLVNQVNMTRGAIAIIDELIGEAQAEAAAAEAVASSPLSSGDESAPHPNPLPVKDGERGPPTVTYVPNIDVRADETAAEGLAAAMTVAGEGLRNRVKASHHRGLR